MAKSEKPDQVHYDVQYVLIGVKCVLNLNAYTRMADLTPKEMRKIIRREIYRVGANFHILIAVSRHTCEHINAIVSNRMQTNILCVCVFSREYKYTNKPNNTTAMIRNCLRQLLKYDISNHFSHGYAQITRHT